MLELAAKFAAHEVVDNRINGAVGVAQPVREQRQHRHHLILAHVNRVSGGGEGKREKLNKPRLILVVLGLGNFSINRRRITHLTIFRQ